ncbi:MAG: hypothetical protein ACR2J8_14340, partial [Thermomicrobiales bacterium]
MKRIGQVLSSSANRRSVLRGVAGAAGFAATGISPVARHVSAATDLSVLSPLAPDPAPPGVAEFAMADFDAWKAANDANVIYEA